MVGDKYPDPNILSSCIATSLERFTYVPIFPATRLDIAEKVLQDAFLWRGRGAKS